MKCAIKICPSAEFLLRYAILLVFINMHKSMQAFVNFSQTTNVELLASVQFKVFEKFTSAYHMRNHVINYS